MPLLVRRGNVAVNPVPSALASIVKVPLPIGAPVLRGGRLLGLVLGVVVVVVELLRPRHQRVAAGAHVEGVNDFDLGRALG